MTGQSAVRKASSVEDLREGNLVLGGKRSRVLGAHSYYFVDDAWTRDGYEAELEAPEVLVGSDEFKELIAESPEIAEAAALGERVIVLGPDGWITIVWPDVDAVD